MEGTVFTPSIEAMQHIRSPEGEMLSKPFLEVCKLILPVIDVINVCHSDAEGLHYAGHLLAFFLDGYNVVTLADKFGPAMTLVKNDIGGNISRLGKKYQSDSTRYNYLYNMVKEEVECKTAKGSTSCTNGILWLTRAMDFLVELFRNLLGHPNWTMAEACTDAYGKTLKKFHGWIASSSFTVAMKLAPERKKFMEVIASSGDVNADMEKFCSSFPPFLEQNHRFLARFGLDDMKV